MLVSVKNTTIGAKIGLGFGIIIAIMLVVGIMSTVKMGKIRHDAIKLAHEYLPELSVADRLERNFFFIMYSMRSYEFTGTKVFYDDAMKYLEDVNKNIIEAQQLSYKHQSLSELKEKADKIASMMKDYDGLLAKTLEVNTAIVAARQMFDKDAAVYMKNANLLMTYQFDAMKKDIASGTDISQLQDRLKKLELIQEIIDAGNAVRIANFKFQTLRNPAIAQEGVKQFDKMFKNMEELKFLVKKQENTEQLKQIEASGREYLKTMEDVLQRWKDLQETSAERVKIATAIREMARETSDFGMTRVDKVADESVKSLSVISLNIFIAMGLALLLAVVIGFLITTRIKKSVNNIADFIKKFGNGDLGSEAEVSSNDEIGQMAKDMNASVKNLKKMMQELADTTNILSSSSEELSAVSQEMAAGAEEMNAQAITVAGASEQVAAGVKNVASSAEQSGKSLSSIAAMTEEMSSTFVHVADSGKKTSENVKEMAKSGEDISLQINAIASAAEEMTVSLNEVAKNTVKANQISQNANQRAQDVNARMTALSVSSKKIGKIINIIKDIADQTNMLALNATIEAAGAGDAGRGFSVVAGEIKELAKQSAGATDEIAGQVEEIQKTTSEAVKAIEDVSQVINQIALINEMIAAASEEQNATASEISKSVANTALSAKAVADKAAESSDLVGEIARAMRESSKTASEVAVNIDELLKSVEDVARSADETARGANDISKNIQGISTASKNAAVGASQTSESATELAKMAASLTQIVNQFKI